MPDEVTSFFESIFGKNERTQPLQLVNCPKCCEQFGIQPNLAAVRQKDGGDVWCPNGHRLGLKKGVKK